MSVYARVSLRASDVSLPQLLKYQSVRKLNRDIVEGVHANPVRAHGTRAECAPHQPADATPLQLSLIL